MSSGSSTSRSRSRVIRRRLAAIGGSIAVVLGAAAAAVSIYQFFDQKVTATGDTPSASSSSSAGPSTSTAPVTPRNPALDVHVGSSIGLLEKRAGDPLKTEKLEGTQNWTERLYVTGDYAITAVVDEQTIVLYSVLICRPTATTAFTTPDGSTVTLMGPPISEAENYRGSTTGLNDRQLFYLEGGTGGSLGHLIEHSLDEPASGNGFRSYLVGINRACGDTDFEPSSTDGLDYFGSIAAAPDELRSFRASHAANFYTEISGDYSIGEDTELTMTIGDVTATGVLASAFIHDLPPEFVAAGTR